MTRPRSTASSERKSAVAAAKQPEVQLDRDAATPAASWSLADAAALYRIDEWGMGFFKVGANGHIHVDPDRTERSTIDLYEVITGLTERGVSAPVIVGFPDLLACRLRDMAQAFNDAVAENGYQGRMTAVYPIKVNQHRYLVSHVERFGRELGFGLEVGSKPELLAVMGLTVDTPDRLIICNGFKEHRYIRHILLATKLGRKIVAVIENISELELLIKQAKEFDVRPRIGVRVKLESQVGSRWHDSTGEKAKFGLHIPGVLSVVERLKAAGMLDCLQLIHCHMGSQISDIRMVNAGINELTRVYVELHKLGAPLEYLDVGGGIGVDYDGSQTNWDFSTNYSLQEYATTVVYRAKSVCDEAEVPHPTIISESGRAMVSQHSLLVVNVVGTNQVDRWAMDPDDPNLPPLDDLHRVLVDLLDARRQVAPEYLVEAYHDALQAREEALTLFKVGNLSLVERGLADRLFWSTCVAVNKLAQGLEAMPEELAELDQRLSDTYFCNLSIFQSLPDSWAIDQVFPITPIHRLDERPTRHATLADITCDSDGKIVRFIDQLDVQPAIPLHALKDDEPYYIAFFLVGAYQETLGDMHNLFGDTNLVHIRVDADGDWEIEEIVEGDTVSEVLTYNQYDPRLLAQAIRRDCERSVREKRLSVAESRTLLEAYEAGLAGYTYLED